MSARNLRVMRGKTEVLHGLDLSIRPGRVTGLLGPSGSGKSTLLRAIVGVQRGIAGELSVLGHPAGSPALRSRVGYMTQAPSVYGDITVEENVRYFASLLGATDRVDEAIETVDLTRYRARTVSSMSGGEQARVSLASALVGDPDLLVLDEPTVGLDPLLRFSLWETFGRLAKAGKTLIVSSHVMDEAASCQDLLLLRDGAILASGTPDDIRHDAGAEDMSQAFLNLIRRVRAAPEPAGSGGRRVGHSDATPSGTGTRSGSVPQSREVTGSERRPSEEGKPAPPGSATAGGASPESGTAEPATARQGMSLRRTLSTMKRVLTQIRHDPRTVALLVVVPCLLLVLLKYVLSGNEAAFQRIGVPMTGLFPFITMFLVASITMLRERTTGTLERLMTLPIAKIDLLFGYAKAFGLLAAVQTLVVTVVGFWGLGLSTPHPAAAVVGLAIANSLLGMALGLFTSALARTEFQAIQFMPAFIFPQLLLCGLLVPREAMATGLYDISKILPMTYAYDALALVASPAPMDNLLRDVLVVVGFIVLALVAGALTLQRRTT